MNGGKEKLDMEVKILMKNAEQARVRFNEFKKMLHEEENLYQNKAKQYGNKWRIQPSNQLNRQYYNEIEGTSLFKVSVWEETWGGWLGQQKDRLEISRSYELHSGGQRQWTADLVSFA